MLVTMPGKRIALSMKSDPMAVKPTGGNSGGGKQRGNAPARKEAEPEGDFQSKLAALKGMFK